MNFKSIVFALASSLVVGSNSPTHAISIVTKEKFGTELRISLGSVKLRDSCSLIVELSGPSTNFKRAPFLTLDNRKQAETAVILPGRYEIFADEKCEQESAVSNFLGILNRLQGVQENIAQKSFDIPIKGSINMELSQECPPPSSRCFLTTANLEEASQISRYFRVNVSSFLDNQNSPLNLKNIDFEITNNANQKTERGTFKAADLFGLILDSNAYYRVKLKVSELPTSSWWVSDTILMTYPSTAGTLNTIYLHPTRFSLKLSFDEFYEEGTEINFKIRNQLSDTIEISGTQKITKEFSEKGGKVFDSEVIFYRNDSREFLNSFEGDFFLGSDPSQVISKKISVKPPEFSFNSYEVSVPKFFNRNSLYIHPAIHKTLTNEEIRKLRSKYELNIIDLRGALGTITSVQTIDSTIRGSTAAGDQFVRNAQAQRFDRDMAQIRRGGNAPSLQSSFMIAEFERFLGSQLNTPDVVQYTHRYAIKTLDGQLVSRDVTSPEQLAYPVGSCVSDFSGSLSLSQLPQNLCEIPDLQMFRATYLPNDPVVTTAKPAPTTPSIPNTASPRATSSAELFPCKIGSNPVIQVQAQQCKLAGGTVVYKKGAKCRFGNNPAIDLDPEKCIAASGEVTYKVN